VCLCWSILLLPTGVIGAQTGPLVRYAYKSADEVRAELLDTQNRIVSFRVKYRAVSPMDSSTGRYIVREVAVKRPCFCYHYGTHGSSHTSWKDDPGQQKAWVLANEYYNEFPLNRVYFHGQIQPSDALPGTLKTENWFQLTGCWPLSARQPPKAWNLVPMLGEVALSSAYCVVRHQIEQVDGHWCHVLECEGSGDALWLDVERGCCLMKREVTEPVHGKLFGRVELSQHVEAVPGVWLPRRLRSLAFSWPAGIQHVTGETLTEVIELRVNDVPDEQFKFTPRPGSVSSSVKGPHRATQTEPGGLDHLDDLVAWALRVYGRPKPIIRFHTSDMLLYLAVGLAFLAVIVLDIRRRCIESRNVAGPPRDQDYASKKLGNSSATG
jgi:hypothetical protein